MKESEFQSKLIKEIDDIFDGRCMILKNDPNYLQGCPDLTVMFGSKWALLECKKSEHEHHQPNQDYYVNWANNNGGFARFIYPENKEEVLNELRRYFE